MESCATRLGEAATCAAGCCNVDDEGPVRIFSGLPRAKVFSMYLPLLEMQVSAVNKFLGTET